MKRTVVSGLMLAALCAPAYAADVLGPPGSDQLDWSGFYAGVHAGYGWGESDPVAPGTPTQNPDGVFGGIQLGFDHRFDNDVVVGFVVDASVADIQGSVQDGGPFLVESGDVGSFGTVRARAGYAIGRFLPYVTGGFAWAHGQAKIECLAGAPISSVCGNPPLAGVSASDSKTSTGWAAGAGIEYAFADRWTVDAAYLHADFGEDTYDFGLFGMGTVRTTLDTLRLGVNYRF
jgi:outer membrane immunogenic protein